ncbi:MAG: transporter [Candidatus Omnitrophota bacterium]|nr:transporter [Candidatus Omnitrophota bacterium]
MPYLIFFLSVLSLTISMPAYAGRPLVTEDVDILSPGDVEIELGVEYLDSPGIGFSARETDRKFVKSPVLGMNIGLGEIVEIQADFDMIYLDQAGISNEYAHGDLRLWTKILAVEESDSRPGLGMRFGSKLPNAEDEDGRGTDETDFFASMLLSKHFDNFYVHLNLGLGILGDPNQTNSQDDVMIYGLAFELPLEETFLTLTAEVSGQAFSNENNNISSARAGFRYDVTEDFIWDVFGGAGLTDESENWSAGTGFTYRFGAFNFSP